MRTLLGIYPLFLPGAGGYRLSTGPIYVETRCVVPVIISSLLREVITARSLQQLVVLSQQVRASVFSLRIRALCLQSDI